MADVEISYNNSVIASLSDSGTEVLETAGTYLTDDITVAFTKGGLSGFAYDVKTVTVNNNTPSVDRAFDDFVFIAQCQPASIPAAASRARLKAYFLMFAYVNGKFIPTTNAKGYSIYTNTAGSADFYGGQTNLNSTVVGATSITFSTYTSQNMQAGTWKVLQIELTSDSPIYAFGDL